MLADVKRTIILLDDNNGFLTTMTMYLQAYLGDKATILPFSQQTDMVARVKNHHYLVDSANDIIHEFYRQNDPDENYIKSSLIALSELAPIIIIDHELENQADNGVGVSRRLKEYFPSCRIAMLTGKLDNKMAVDLHNEEIIDMFINKGADHACEQLLAFIHRNLESWQIDEPTYPETLFSLYTAILEDSNYRKAKEKILSQINYLAYLTTSALGELAILGNDKYIYTLKYDQQTKEFVKNVEIA